MINKIGKKTGAGSRDIKVLIFTSFVFSLLFLVNSSILADIQSPPRKKYTPVRKLSRSLANILYGSTEIPSRISKYTKTEGASVGVAHGLINGTYRTAQRIGSGVYDLVTFPFPTYKRGYKPNFKKKYYKDVESGYTSFPPEIGDKSQYRYSRSTRY